MNNKLELIEEYEYLLEELKLIIKVGKMYDEGEKQELYFAKSNYKNIFSVSESREKAIEYCIKKIKFKREVLKGNIKLIKVEEGITIAKKAFNKHFGSRKGINAIVPYLSFNSETDDELLTINITYSKNYKFEEAVNQFPYSFAIIFVNLIMGTCEILENTKIADLYLVSAD